MTRDVLILGGSGHSGTAFARAFAAAGWQVRTYVRGTDPVAAARGVALIVNAMNPPDYHDWQTQIPRITRLAMTAARASGARVLIPGNVYVYGRQPAPWSAATPHLPCSRKGAIRAEMEAAWRDSGLAVTILRAGDFLDGAQPGLTMGRVVLTGLHKGRITALGAPDVRRAYAFLPDFARAAVALSQRDDLPRFADIPFPGHSFSLTELSTEITRQTGRPLRISRFPWAALRLLSPVWELAREFSEMRYLFEHPHWLERDSFASHLPKFSPTPLPEIIAGHLPIQRSQGLQMPEPPQRSSPF
ncbi:epimerase [Salipiger mangrovisoli]|uniref:Epimerase n=1 Tax=Salipiger mangrovisoli TaxID=2865933 RepID=A0ABR9X1I9_9RHOB|nr:epimerase [Salipiger mangrovisoli]MBE9637368.1 epimerase [Salipiger mangrovisoli]